MERVFFEEKQTLSGTVIAVVAIAGLGLCFPFIRGLYIRMILQGTWGDPSLTNTRIVWILCGLALAAALVVWLVAVQYQEIKIDEAGIHYRVFPQQRNVRTIDRKSIASYDIRKLKWYEMIQGNRKRRLSWMGEQDVHVIGGNTALVLTLSGGRKLILGTRNPDGVMWAMRKLLSNP